VEQVKLNGCAQDEPLRWQRGSCEATSNVHDRAARRLESDKQWIQPSSKAP